MFLSIKSARLPPKKKINFNAQQNIENKNTDQHRIEFCKCQCSLSFYCKRDLISGANFEPQVILTFTVFILYQHVSIFCPCRIISYNVRVFSKDSMGIHLTHGILPGYQKEKNTTMKLHVITQKILTCTVMLYFVDLSTYIRIDCKIIFAHTYSSTEPATGLRDRFKAYTHPSKTKAKNDSCGTILYNYNNK